MTSRWWRTSTVLASVLIAACGGSSSAGDASGDSSEDQLVASFDSAANIDLSKTTHLLLVGDSDELGELPLYSATTRAHRYAQLYPNDQIVLFVTKDVKDATVVNTGASVIRDDPFPNVALSDLRALSTSKLFAAMDRFSSIASLDFFGHSSPFGALVESTGSDRSISGDSPAVAQLADNFARDRDPYVTLNGCNGGVEVAAALSHVWQLPVSGALTGSNFQVLMSDGRWYANDTGFYPPQLKPTTKNTASFGPDLQPACAKGACVRMKPQDSPYYGVWGRSDTGFQYGLSYYKFFCNYDGADSNGSCSRGMARSLHAFASIAPIDEHSTDDAVKPVLADFFCSGAKDAAWFDQCQSALFAAAESGAAFSPMKSANDYSLECDFQKCEQKFGCQVANGMEQPHTCVWVNAQCTDSQSPQSCKTKNTEKQTTNREFARYLEGQRLLRGQ